MSWRKTGITDESPQSTTVEIVEPTELARSVSSGFVWEWSAQDSRSYPPGWEGSYPESAQAIQHIKGQVRRTTGRSPCVVHFECATR